MYNTFLTSFLKKTGISEIKLKQIEIFNCLMNKTDCFAILPTGYGKSLPHQLYIPVKKALNSEKWTDEKVLVCCPLVSLMEDQVQRMTRIDNVSVAYRGQDPETDKLIEDGHYDVIFASPEALAEEWVRNIRNVRVIVVDECHTVSSWGGLDSADEEKAFRKCFRYIGSLRSLFPDATLLALSATCTLQMKKQIKSVLNMNNATTVEMSPNQANIKYIVMRTPSDVEETLFWLVDRWADIQDKMGKTLIYCKSIQDVCKIYYYLTTELNCTNGNIIEMFHSETPESKKELIVQNLTKKSNLKIVIATTALGMGIDVSECYCTILYGPSKDIVDLLQESGRCGRDGSRSVAVIFCNRYQMGHVSDHVKDVIKCTDCRRKSILRNFTTDDHLVKPLHHCCDLCAFKCNCGSCDKLPMQTFLTYVSVKNDGTDPESSDSDTVSYEYECSKCALVFLCPILRRGEYWFADVSYSVGQSVYKV